MAFHFPCSIHRNLPNAFGKFELEIVLLALQTAEQVLDTSIVHFYNDRLLQNRQLEMSRFDHKWSFLKHTRDFTVSAGARSEAHLALADPHHRTSACIQFLLHPRLEQALHRH